MDFLDFFGNFRIFFITYFNFLDLLDFFLFFFYFFKFFSKLRWLLLKITKVTTGHQKRPKMGQNNTISSFYAQRAYCKCEGLEEHLPGAVEAVVAAAPAHHSDEELEPTLQHPPVECGVWNVECGV